ncbi:unnamed protein product [Cylindrotheca closterium]|uniref:Alpha 1,4-glycosyltransferase domain-containing protein n=1 Tax=Cylindrotheca closterium TaxID=2856 RepID=A0AAD2FS40_9STRA|nr:unnamed protein product [Cylindrotheca closterium]
MLETKHPIDLYNNVLNTIHEYSRAWSIPAEEMDIMFIDDPLCLKLIPQVEPRLLEYFKLEPKGSFKADICRVAALHLYGGYYFDVDIQVLKALQPNPDTDFITSTCGNHQFFQAVMALAPEHPLARATLDSMLDDWYQIPTVMEYFSNRSLNANFSMGEEYIKKREEYLGRFFNMSHEIKPMLGTATLRLAYDRHRKSVTPWILDELDNADNTLYPELKREDTGWGCNYMVHDGSKMEPYFYSRCMGTEGCPHSKPWAMPMKRGTLLVFLLCLLLMVWLSLALSQLPKLPPVGNGAKKYY